MRQAGYQFTVLFGIRDFYHRFNYVQAWPAFFLFADAANLPEGPRTLTLRQVPLTEALCGQPKAPHSGEILRMYTAAPVQDWAFSNSFGETVCALHPVCARARDALREGGALAARLTGSGSAVIGLFADQPSAVRCAGALAASGHTAACLSPLATIPAVCYYECMRIRQWEATHGNYGYSHQEGRI
jgi:hypothetical protein